MGMMNKRIPYIVIGTVIGVIATVAVLLLSTRNDGKSETPTYTEHTDTVLNERVDTITLEHTVTRYRPTPSRVDTFWCVTASADSADNETERHISKTYDESGSYEDTTCIPSARVDYSLRIRTMDYDVDSIGMRLKVDYPKVTETKTITNTVYRKRHFTHGVQIGVGYGLMNNRPDVFVGYGVQYNF